MVSSTPSLETGAGDSVGLEPRGRAATAGGDTKGADDSIGGGLTLFREARFLVDAMLGRLLRWLRVLGIDTLLREEGEDLRQFFQRAQSERRIILTRDRKLAERRDDVGVGVFVVGSDESREQLREVVRHFGLKLSASEFMMRCSVCNGRGYLRVSRDEAILREDCPPKVAEAVEEFYACRSCGKLYWEGPKSNNAFDHFEKVFEQMQG